MATAVKKGGKINFAKVVAPAKEEGDQVATIKSININIKATNDLNKTWNSIAKILMDTKNIQVEAFKKLSKGAKVEFKPTFNQSEGATPVPEQEGGEEAPEKPQAGWLENLLGVFKDIIMLAIAGPVMKWLSDPKNTKAVKNIVEGLVKFFGFIMKFLTNRVLNGLEGLRKVIEGNWWEKIVGLFQIITNFSMAFLAIRWLKNPMKLVKDLKKLFKVFTKGLKMTSKKMIKKLGVIGLIIGAGMMLKDKLKGEEEDEDGGGTTINGNKLSSEDSIEYDNLRLRLESLENEQKTHGDPEFDKVYARQEELENKYRKLPKKAKGGWIHGPQSGYPVSLDGGKSTSFIGHGTEYVAQRSHGGGFVVPFDTPATRKDSGLTGRRMRQASSAGYKVPGRSEGGPINVNNFFPELPEFNTGGKMKNQNTGRIKNFDKSHYGTEGYQIGQINPEQLVFGKKEFIEKTVTVNGVIDEEQSFKKFESIMGSIGVPDLMEHQQQLISALKQATGKKYNIMDVYYRMTGLDNDVLFPILKSSDAHKATDKKKAAAHQKDLKIRGIKPGEGYSIFEGEMFDKGGLFQPTLSPVINMMSEGGIYQQKPQLHVPQPMFLGGMIRKGASLAKKGGQAAWSKISSTASSMMSKATDAVRGLKGQSKKEKQEAAMQALQAAQEQAAAAEAKVAALSAASQKTVAGATGAANSKKPLVVGGGAKKESLVDQLQSYNSIWK